MQNKACLDSDKHYSIVFYQQICSNVDMFYGSTCNAFSLLTIHKIYQIVISKPNILRQLTRNPGM